MKQGRVTFLICLAGDVTQSKITNPKSKISRASAFTLTELLISIALAVILILGVNEVFSITARTVGAGQSLSGTYRDTRAAQTLINRDFNGAVPMSMMPCLIISSQYGYGFRNRADFSTDVDQNPGTIDLTGSGTETAIPPALIGPRSHRLDQIGFFSRGLFTRQTGSGNSFIDTIPGTSSGLPVNLPVTSSEAWIVYGHLNLPDNNGNWTNGTNPGAGVEANNPNNFYAGQWVLGRSAILLSPNPPATAKFYLSTGGVTPLDLTASQAQDATTLASCSYDTAQTSVSTFAAQLATQCLTPTGQPKVPAFNFWTPLLGYNSNPQLTVRFQALRYPFEPLTSIQANKIRPCFLAGCTQFIVEYTGDFVTQDNNPASSTYGQITGYGSDGVPDYQIVNGARQTRWYGLPRDTNNDGIIDSKVDVVPLRDVIGTLPGPPVVPFERVLPAAAANATAPNGYGGMQSTDQYVVAWGPDTQAANPPSPTPTMLRITVGLDDMSNRTGGAQIFEFVVLLPQ